MTINNSERCSVKSGSEHDTNYYNLIGGSSGMRSECSETESSRPMAPSSPSSAEDETKEPLRPPRGIDLGDDHFHLHTVPSYCNLPTSTPMMDPIAPSLPRRQPHFKRQCTSPIHKRHPPPVPLAPPPPPPPRGEQFGPVVKEAIYQNQNDYFHSQTGSRSGSRRRRGVSGQPLGPTISRNNSQRKESQCACGDNKSTITRRTGSSSNGSCNNVPPATDKGNGVVLVYSRFCQGSVEWANYLHKLFTELSKLKGKFNLSHLPVEDLAGNVIPTPMEEDIYHSRLQIVLLSPIFLEFLRSKPSYSVGRILHPDRVLAIMLGVKDNRINQDHRDSLVSFSQWIHLEAKDHDMEFVQTVIYFSTQILNRSNGSTDTNSVSTTSMRPNRLQKLNSITNLPQSRPQTSTSMRGRLASVSTQAGGESNFFHVHPKKLTENHNRLVLVFETPQSAHAHIRIRIERMKGDQPVTEICEWRFLNPYNIQASLPSCCFSSTTLAGVRVEIDGQECGIRSIKLESILGELEHLMRQTLDPLDVMCQAFGIVPPCRETLDKRLAMNLRGRLPTSGLHALRLFNDHPKEIIRPKEYLEYPTLLHFSAYHGLHYLCTILLQCPGANVANETKNAAGMTPAELAQSQCHFELADKLFNSQAEISYPHIYDYIQQSRNNPNDSSLMVKPVVSEYQVPPPPRPVPGMVPAPPYLDMAGSGGSGTSSSTESPKQKRRPSFNILTQTLKFRAKAGKENQNLGKSSKMESPPHQELPPPKDPYGTMRANSGRDCRKILEEEEEDSNHQNEDDVFLPPINKSSSADDPFGTLRANRALHKTESAWMDYRGCSEAKPGSIEDELAVTNELLQMLEDFKTKSLSLKEMEIMFDNWRRKASYYDQDLPRRKIKPSEFEEIKEKLRKYKTNSSLAKFFKSNPAKPAVSMDDLHIKTTKETKANKRTSLITDKNGNFNNPKPQLDNETIVESELCIINESEMSMVQLPPTPQKRNYNECHVEGVSTQILPLSRLSMSSGSSPTISEVGKISTGSDPKDPIHVRESQGTQTPKPVSPFREKLAKLRKSLTEPLYQYFHEIQHSPECEEPEILNTPRSLVPSSRSLSPVQGLVKPSKRNLLKDLEDDTEEDEGAICSSENGEHDRSLPYINLPPPPIVTDM
ncbi:uncharacterized protein LOC131886916 isoform X1 [Tigriopus californicus]|uniref:uncharacterized protein LOC131886916 isoform X1 n=1 Tax=Tigriopus californicus TaxID=6832 RepID=UPI0027DA78DD|nr:uncharacterized protein LOC131886916 isoform X1 [Tigriopus californicus]